AILLLVPDGDHDAGVLAALHNRDHRVRLRFPEIWIEKLVAAVFRCVENRRAPLLRTVDGPVLELAGDLAQHIPAHRILLAISVEETDHSLGQLKRLEQTVKKPEVAAPSAECDAVFPKWL